MAAALLLRGHARARFLLCGDGTGPDNAALTAVLEEAGVADRCLRLGRRQDMPAVYAALDVACMASPYGEAFPNAVAEALACGVPVAATRVGDAPRILGGMEEGGADDPLLAQPGDPESLAAALDRLACLAPEQRAALGAAGRERVAARYSLQAMAGRYAALYRDLAAGREPGGETLQGAGPCAA
jgi:glycosyltransferase involved in cell wall biosynthesis